MSSTRPETPAGAVLRLAVTAFRRVLDNAHRGPYTASVLESLARSERNLAGVNFSEHLTAPNHARLADAWVYLAFAYGHASDSSAEDAVLRFLTPLLDDALDHPTNWTLTTSEEQLDLALDAIVSAAAGLSSDPPQTQHILSAANHIAYSAYLYTAPPRD